MRIYGDCYQLMSETMREVWEMGHIVHPHTMQNKKVADDDNFSTKEIINYSYCLQTLDQSDWLFFEDSAKEWVRDELAERLDPNFINPGYAWKTRRKIWEPFINHRGLFDYTYNQRLDPRLKVPHLIREIKKNPDSRQLILSIWDSNKDFPYIGTAVRRVPCSIYYQFMVRDNKVHIIYNQRSADLITHLGNDIWLAYNLMATIVNSLRGDGYHYEYGYLYHNIASLHSYKKDWDVLRTTLSEIKK